MDDVDSPKVALIWHYCGFANILGDYNERFIGETVSMMRNPLDGHSGRLPLQAENALKLQEMILKTPGVSKYDRYIFEFRGEKNVTAPVTGLKPEEINADNFDLMRGWIVPTFSWETKNAFLEKGFEIIGTHPWYKYEG